MSSLHPDQQKWNAKYQKRPFKLSEVEPYIKAHISDFKPGTLLDFACGDGRNALYLSSQGFQITGADISDEGLKRLEKFATEQELNIQTTQVDLSNPDQVNALGTYDNVLICRYKPAPEILALLPNLMKAGGMLMFYSFNVLHARQNNFSEKFCLRHRELLNFWPNMELVKYDENIGRFSDGYIFKKHQ